MRKRVILFILVCCILTNINAICEEKSKAIHVPRKDQGIVNDYLKDRYSDFAELFNTHYEEILVACMTAAQLSVLDEDFQLRMTASKSCDDIVAFIGMGQHESGNQPIMIALQDYDLSYILVVLIPGLNSFAYIPIELSRSIAENIMNEFCYVCNPSPITYKEVVQVNELIEMLSD